MLKARNGTRYLIAATVAMMFIVCQIFLATHVHSGEYGSHKSSTSYACAVCLVKATSHDATGPAPFAPAIRIVPLQRFVGIQPAEVVLPDSVIPSRQWARGPPLGADQRTAA